MDEEKLSISEATNKVKATFNYNPKYTAKLEIFS